MTIESDIGRLDLSLPGSALAGVKKGASLLSRRFRDTICTLGTMLSFRLCASDFNKQSGRTGTGDELTRSSVVNVIMREADE